MPSHHLDDSTGIVCPASKLWLRAGFKGYGFSLVLDEHASLSTLNVCRAELDQMGASVRVLSVVYWSQLVPACESQLLNLQESCMPVVRHSHC